MAEEKGGIISNAQFAARVFGILFFLYLISVLLMRILDLLYSRGISASDIWQSILLFILAYIVPVLIYLGLFIALFSFFLLVHSYRKLSAIVREEREIYRPTHAAIMAEAKAKNDKWERILVLSNSANPSDWRLAIIEADVMLDELLRKLGYHGDTIGDMLKAVEKSDMTTLESAWEAHKVRNRIAHSGTDFAMNEREAKRVIAHYEAVFKEFGII